MVERGFATTTGCRLKWIGLRTIHTDQGSTVGIEQLSFPRSKKKEQSTQILRTSFGKQRSGLERNLVCNCRLIPMAFEGCIFTKCRLSELPKRRQMQRNVSVEAGRSKKRAGQKSSGRLEGGAQQRRAQNMIAERRRMRKLLRKKPPTKLSTEEDLEEEEFTEEELQMVGLGYYRSVRFKDKDDPTLRHPHDWYKYGPNGPHAWKGIVVGKPVRGRMSDMRVTMFSTVRDEEEQERIDQNDVCVHYDRRIQSFDENIGIKYFWVFVRQTQRVKPELPWNEWTLVCQIAIESGEKLDKYRVGSRVTKKVRNVVTQCTAWFRPDLIYVKKPTFEARFEPQEDFLRGLVSLLDPFTEKQYSFLVPIGEGEGEGEMDTYYGCLCRILGVDADTSENDVVSAYEKLNDEQKSLCWDFLFTNHPVQLLHPFTKGWRAREEAMARQDSSRVDGFIGSISRKEDNEGEEEDSDEGESQEDDDGEDDGEETSEGESQDDDDGETFGISSAVDVESEYDSQVDPEEFWEREFQKSLKILESEDSDNLESEAGLEDGGLDMPLQSVDGEENNNESENPPEILFRSAVRPFTYTNLFKEIVLLRYALIRERSINMEPIKFR
eukprot:Gb_35628 [translate_table: standard]